jgi:hypothetical protein
MPDYDPRRLPTPEGLAKAIRTPARTPTCVVCWQEREDVDNGVCGSCRATLGKRVTNLAIDNAKLREALRVATTTVEEWEAHHGCRHPDPEGFRRAAIEQGKAALDG